MGSSKQLKTDLCDEETVCASQVASVVSDSLRPYGP